MGARSNSHAPTDLTSLVTYSRPFVRRRCGGYTLRGRLQVTPCGTTAGARLRTSRMEEGMAHVVMPAVPRSCAAAAAVASAVAVRLLVILIAKSPSGMDTSRVC